MQDDPTPVELTKAVADFLRSDIAPQISGHTGFKLRVAINALDLVTRQLSLQNGFDAAELERLRALLGSDGDLATLNAELAQRISRSEADLATPGVAEHLWKTVLEKLAVDQPNYASYRRERDVAASG